MVMGVGVQVEEMKREGILVLSCLVTRSDRRHIHDVRIYCGDDKGRQGERDVVNSTEPARLAHSTEGKKTCVIR